jgi:hypothetical protein
VPTIVVRITHVSEEQRVRRLRATEQTRDEIRVEHTIDVAAFWLDVMHRVVLLTAAKFESGCEIFVHRCDAQHVRDRS